MTDIITNPDLHKDGKRDEKRHLAWLRRWACERGFRVLRDRAGGWSLVDAKPAPPRALTGLEHVALSTIETALLTPLPPPRRNRRRLPPIIAPTGAPTPLDWVELSPATHASNGGGA